MFVFGCFRGTICLFEFVQSDFQRGDLIVHCCCGCVKSCSLFVRLLLGCRKVCVDIVEVGAHLVDAVVASFEVLCDSFVGGFGFDFDIIMDVTMDYLGYIVPNHVDDILFENTIIDTLPATPSDPLILVGL